MFYGKAYDRRGDGTLKAKNHRADRIRRNRLQARVETLEDRKLLTLSIGLSGSELLLTGDSTLSSLNVDYNSSTNTYTLTANSGETFAAATSFPSTVTLSSSSNVATLQPNGSNTWASLGYSLGDTTSTTTAIELGSSSAPASKFATPFDTATTTGGTVALTVTDAAGTYPQNTNITSSSLTFGAAPSIDYGSATLSGLTFDAANVGSNHVDVLGTPTAPNPLSVDAGTGSGNIIIIGNAASRLSNIDVSTGSGGVTSIQIDDSGASNPHTIDVTSSQTSFVSGPTIDYSAATLNQLFIYGPSTGSSTMNITSTPVSMNPLFIGFSTGLGDVVNLGSSTIPASTVGNVSIGSAGGAPLAINVNDSADFVSQTTNLLPGSLTVGSSMFNYSGATIEGLTFDAANVGGNTVVVSGTPTAANLLSVDAGSGSGNFIYIGNAASQLSNIDVSTSGGKTSLEIDDSYASNPHTIDVTSSQTSFVSGPTINYSAATLTLLLINGPNTGSSTANITSTPAAANPLSIGFFGGTGNVVNLGSSTVPASTVGNVSIGSAGGAPLAINVNDSADSVGQSTTVSSSSLTVGTSTFKYANATLSGLTFDAANVGTNNINVNGTPTAANPLSIDAGSGSGNSIYIGNAANRFSNINVSTSGGSTSLQIDDSNASNPHTIDITSLQTSFVSGPTIDYSGANLNQLFINGPNAGSSTANITSTPTTTNPLIVQFFSGLGDVVNLGSSTVPASAVGNVTIGTGSGAPLAINVNDSADSVGQSTTISASSSLVVGSSTFNYAFAMIEGLTFDASNVGGNTVVVAGTPTAANPLSIAMGSGINNSLTLGTPSSPVTTLGAVAISTSGSGTSNLTIDDSGDGSGQSTFITSGLIQIGMSQTFSLGGFSAHAITFDASNAGGNTATVVNYPVGLMALTLDMGSGGSNAVDLGNATNPAENLGPVDITTNTGGSTSLTIDDTSGSMINQTSISAAAFEFVGFSTFTFGGASLTGLTFDGSNQMAIDMSVTGTPIATNPLVVDMGSSTGNSVSIGNAANQLSNIDVSTGTGGTTSLLIDDTAAANPHTMDVTATAVSFVSGSTINYASASLTNLTLDGPNTGSNTVNVTGTPTSPTPFSLSFGSGTGDVVNLGSSTVAAASIGDVSLNGGSNAPLTLNIDDATDTQGQNINITSSGVLIPGLDFSYSGATLKSLTFDGSTAGGNILGVSGEANGLTSLTINDSAPSTNFDQLFVDGPIGSTTFSAPVVLQGSGTAALGFNDMSGLGASPYVLQSGSFTLGGAGIVDFSGLAHPTSLTLIGTYEPATWNVVTTPANIPTTIEMGLGDNTIVVAAQGLSPNGTLAITKSQSIPRMPVGNANDLTVNAQFTTSNVLTPGTIALGSGSKITYSYLTNIVVNSLASEPVFIGVPPISTTVGDPLLGVPIAAFHDVTGVQTAGAFGTSIDWADGSPASQGTIVADPTTPGEFLVLGSHTYHQPSVFNVKVGLADQGGTFHSIIGGVPITSNLSAIAPEVGSGATISTVSSPITGGLSPQSDTGSSPDGNVTRITTPTFQGTATPFATIQIVLSPGGLIATGTANANGFWTASDTSTPLAQGVYSMTSIATIGSYHESTSLGSLTIDTTPPVVTGVTFRPGLGAVSIRFQDNLSGLNTASLLNPANYRLAGRPAPHRFVLMRRWFTPTNLELSHTGSPTNPYVVTMTWNDGRRLPMGRYVLNVIAGGVKDVAGNSLAGSFSGSFPTRPGFTSEQAGFSAQTNVFQRYFSKFRGIAEHVIYRNRFNHPGNGPKRV
jgi:hypothetical protein